jgi:hypothetical protein
MTQEELEQYHELLKKGIISEEEYAEQKRRFFESRGFGPGLEPAQPYSNIAGGEFWGMEEKSYIVFMHASVLAGVIFPFAGFILPLVMWMSNKDKSERVDAHGKVVMNWVLSSVVYGLIFGILCLILIGIPLLIALSVCTFIFSIMGAVKASEGQLWPYPLSIQFIK